MLEIKDKFKKAEIKMTKPRLAVFKILQNSATPLSALQIHKKSIQIDLSSVYRTLDLFEKKNLVNSEFSGDEKIYCFNNVPHHHIICSKCGYTESFKCGHTFKKKFNNFININHRLTLSGVCKKCIDKYEE